MAGTTTPFLKKALFTVLAAAAMNPMASAQVTSYFFSQNATTYTALSAGTIIAQATGTNRLTDGNFSATLPFSFNFNGTGYTTINVNANGYITFGATTPAVTLATPISSATGYSGAVAAFGTDIEGVFDFTATLVAGDPHLGSVSRMTGLRAGQTVTGTGIPAGTTISAVNGAGVTLSNPPGANGTTVTLTAATGTIATQTLGTAPNRTFVIQWDGFRMVGGLNSSLNFQISLSEGGGVALAQNVQVIYGNSVPTSAGGAEIGLRGLLNVDYNNRTSANTFTNTTAGAANTATIGYNTGTVIPSGLTYTWSRTALAACSGAPTGGQAVSSVPSSCAGSLALSAVGATIGTGINYQWQSSALPTSGFTNITGATTNPYTATSTNSTIYYRLAVTCGVGTPVNSATASVGHDALTVNLGNDTTLCPGAIIALNAGNPGQNFSWSNGVATQENDINTGATYTVIVTDPLTGCTGQDAIVVTNAATPTVNLGPDRSICQGTSTTLNAGNAGASFNWNTGAITQSISVNRNGTFIVTVTNAQHCSNSDTLNISIDPLPSAAFISYSGIMPTFDFSVSLPANVTNYLWIFNDAGATSPLAAPTHTFTHNGNFNVLCVLSNTCGTDTLRQIVPVTNAGNGVRQTLLNADLISLYPNPAHDYVLLDNKQNLKLQEVTVMNMVGATVLRQSGKDTKMQIATTSLPAGTYLLRIVTDQGIAARKMEVLK